MELKKERDGSGGAIPGECVVDRFVGQIEIDDWRWGVSRERESKSSSAPALASDVSDHGKPVPSIFSFSKRMDRSTTAMLNAAKSGALLWAKITLEGAEAILDGKDAIVGGFLLVIKLQGVRIIKYDMEGKNDKASAELTESWDFNYESIAFEHSASGGDRRKPTVTLRLSRPAGAKATAIETGMDIDDLRLAKKYFPGEVAALYKRTHEEAAKQAAKQTNG